MNEFKELKSSLQNKLLHLLNETETIQKFLISTNYSLDDETDPNKVIPVARLKNIIDTNMFRFNKIKKILFIMEEENRYLIEWKGLDAQTSNSN